MSIVVSAATVSSGALDGMMRTPTTVGPAVVEGEEVGQGRHVRFAVDLDRQRKRLESKAEKLKAAG